MRRIWFQGGSFIAAAGALLVLGAVNCLSLRAAELRMLPPTFPTTNRIRLQLDGLSAGQRAQVEAIPKLGSASETFAPVLVGSRGESVFDIPVPWSEEGYFRAVALDPEPSSSALDLLIPTALQRVAPGQRLRLAPQGALVAADIGTLENGWMEIATVVPSSNAGQLSLVPSDRVRISAAGSVRLAGVEVARMSTGSNNLRLQFSRAASPALVSDLIRQIEYTAHAAGPEAKMRVVQWRCEDGLGHRSRPRVQTVELAEICDEPLDVALVLDRTSSISLADFDLLRQAATRFVEQLGLSAGLRQAAVVSFCSSAFTHVPLTSDLTQLRTAISGLQRSAHLNGVLCDGTVVGSGILEGLRLLDQPTHRRVILLLTDGWESSTTSTRDLVRQMAIDAAAEARNQDVRLVVYALGTNPDTAHLQKLVAGSDDLIPASDYVGLPAQLVQIAGTFCDANNPLPQVFAGDDLRVRLPLAAELHGFCSNCTSSAQARWEVVSGPGAVGLSARALVSQATFSEPGAYRLRLTVAEGLFRGVDDLEVIATASNHPPEVRAQFEPLTAAEILLSAEATDDGIDRQGFRSNEPLTYRWRASSGPGAVTFERPGEPVTFARFSEPGDYSLELEVLDAGGLSTTSVLQVHVIGTSSWELFPSAGYVSTGLGGLRNRGQGTLTLRGVHGPVRRAYLYWHGPMDSERPDANARIRFQGRWIEGVPLGLSHDDGWTYAQNHPYAVGQSYRADVSSLVEGDGDYTVSDLMKTPQVNVNGASLVVMFEEPDPSLRRDVRLWSGNESNGEFAPAANGEVEAFAVYPDGRVLMGGAFTEVGEFPRNRLARLYPTGQADLSFDPSVGADGTVRSLALQADGSIWVGGSFTHIGGKPRNGLARLAPNGSLVETPESNTKPGSEVFGLLIKDEELWVVGSEGIRRLDSRGNPLTAYDPGAVVRTVCLGADGTLWFGGDKPGAEGTRDGWLGRLRINGPLEQVPCEVNGRISTLAESLDGGWYVGGTFSEWNTATRHGVARLTREGELDLDWYADSLNQLPGQEVTSLHVQVPGPDLPWSTSLLVVGGRLSFPTDSDIRTVALCRLVDGAVDRERFEVLLRDERGRVDVVTPTGDEGHLWIGGTFVKETQRNRALFDQGGHLLTENSGDQGWNLMLQTGANPAMDVVELHVSDGQPCLSCLGQEGGQFLDPLLLLNDQPWNSPKLQTLCDVEQEQLFAGLSVPSALDECWKGHGLWDVVQMPLGNVDRSRSPFILRSEYSGAPSQEDLVTLVAAAVLSPPDTNAFSSATFHNHFPRDDRFQLARLQSNQRLLVMSNDRLPAGARIESVSQPSAAMGTVRVAPDATSLIFEPDMTSNLEVSDTFSYVVGWGGRNVATGHVTLALSGPAPVLLPEQGTSTPLKLTSGPSFFRGPRHFSQVFIHEAIGSERLELAVLDPKFSAHLYLRDGTGDLVAAAWHDSDPFGAFGPRITPLYLSWEIRKPGRYLIEVAGNQPGEGGAYTLRVGSELPEGDLVGLRVNGLQVSDHFEVGWVPASESVIDVQWDNSTTAALEGFRFEAYSDHPAIEVSLSASETRDLAAGETGRWLCRIRRPSSIQQGTSELILRAWVGGRMVHRAVGRLYFGPGASGLHVEAHPVSSNSYELEAVALAGQSAAPATFVVESDRTQTILSGSGNTVTWSNAVPGLYSVWAYTESAASARIPLRVEPPKPLGEAVADHFQVGLGTVSNRLNVLANDSALVRVVSVTPAILGFVKVLPDGALEYSPSPGSLGDDHFTYTAVDIAGTPVSAEVRVEVAEAAIRWLEPGAESHHAVGSPIRVRIQVDPTRASAVQTRFFANDQRVSSGEGATFEFAWTPNQTGFITLLAEILDEQGNWWKSSPLRVGIGKSDDRAPVAAISFPTAGELIELDRLEVRGTAMDPDETSSYHLTLRRPDGSVVHEQAGIGPVVEGRLGDIDLTLLRNGSYDLTLVVMGGVEAVRQTVRFVLQSDAKVGQLLFTETDLELPSAGLPLVLARTYDSLNPTGGDFGPGWTLSLYDLQVEIDEERDIWVDPDTESRQEVRIGGGRDIALTLPGGMRVTFRHSLKPGANDGGVPCFCYEARWEAPPGLSATLTAMGNRELRFIPFQQELPPFWTDAGPGTPMENYDFRGWVLTNVDGAVLEIVRPNLGTMPIESDSALARSVEVYGRPVLHSMRLPTGERVEISEASHLRIDHLDALRRRTRSLVLKRGSQGFITEAYDSSSVLPSGEVQPGALPVVRYDYDPLSGLLTAVRRLVDRNTGHYSLRSYAYTNQIFPHYLTELRDERGVVALRPSYDPEGRLTGMTDAAGHTTLMQHERSRRREESVDSLGNRTVHDYDQFGNVVQSVDPTGRITRRSFGRNHQLLAETNAWGTAGESWTLRTYDGAGHLTSQAGKQGTNLFLFDAVDRLISHRDPYGITTTNTYDDQGRLVSSMRLAGNSHQETKHRYDEAGRLIESRDATGNLTRYGYDVIGQLTNQTVVSPDGVALDASSMSYDSNGNKRTESALRRGFDGALETATHTFDFDAQNRLVQTSDPLGGIRQTLFDEQGRQVAQRDELGRWTRHFYDRRGQLIQTVYPSDAQTPRVVTRTFYDAMAHPIYVQQATFLPETESETNSLVLSSGHYTVYDELGRVARAGQCRELGIRIGLDRDGIVEAELVGNPEILSVRETGYDAAGRMAWLRDANGITTAYGYDEAGRRTTVTNAWDTPRQTVQRSIYSTSGLLSGSVDPAGRRTDYSFDEWGRRVATWMPEVEGRRQAAWVAYDEAGRQVFATNEMGLITGYGYDALGRLTSVTNALGSSNEVVTRYGFDEAGNQISQTDALGRTTRYAYDALGRRVMRELPAGEREYLSYDAVGNLILRTNFNGRVIDQRFDARNRLWRKVERLAEREELMAEFTFTSTGRRATQLDPSGPTTYSYDDWDRLQVRDKPGWGRLEYEYLPSGQVTTTVIDTGAKWWKVRYDYDELGRLTGASIPMFDVGASYKYDQSGMLSETRYANGVTNSYRYDDRNRLRQLTWAKNGEEYARFDYQVNEAGQRVQLEESFSKLGKTPRTYRWEYDDLQRLTHETISGLGVASYSYDLVGNRLRRDSTLPGVPSTRTSYDRNDRMDPDQDPLNVNPDYDAAGNTLRGEYQGRRYEDRYDAENRLIERRYLVP